jgi:hypothetical protein
MRRRLRPPSVLQDLQYSFRSSQAALTPGLGLIWHTRLKRKEAAQRRYPTPALILLDSFRVHGHPGDIAWWLRTDMLSADTSTGRALNVRVDDIHWWNVDSSDERLPHKTLFTATVGATATLKWLAAIISFLTGEPRLTPIGPFPCPAT